MRKEVSMFKNKKYFLITYNLFGVKEPFQTVVIAKDKDIAKTIFDLHYKMHSYVHVLKVEEIECLK